MTDPQATSQESLLLFRVADRRLALPLRDVTRVVHAPLLLPAVGAPYFVEGFFDYRGAAVATIRLERLLGLDEDRLGIYAPLLLLAGGDQRVALHVTRVDAVLKGPAACVQPIGPDETVNACVVGQVSDRGETACVLSTDRLLLAAEREALAVHEAMTQQRVEWLSDHATHAA